MTPNLQQARRAVFTVFFVNGLTISSWLAVIPVIKERLGLSEGVLGLTLLATAVGALLAMQLTGWLLGRYGSRRITQITIIYFVASVFLPLGAPSLFTLVLALALFGAGNGASDVAMNAQGVQVEDRYPKPIMSSFHGAWSLGSLSGAGLAALLLFIGITGIWHAGVVAALGAGLLVYALPRLLEAGDKTPTEADNSPRLRPRKLPRALLILGLLSFLSLVSEGAVADWAAVYLREGLGSSLGLAPLGFAAFSLTMALGRFTGDTVAGRLGAAVTLRLSALLSVLGLGAALLMPTAPLALLGFGLMGLGVANFAPLLFGAGGRVPGVPPGAGIAAVTTAGYTGFLVGPPLIGFTAEALGLRLALFLVVGFLAVIGVFASSAQVTPKATLTDGGPAEDLII